MAKPRVSLFTTCVVDQLYPKVGIAMAEVLERAGYDLDVPDGQTCCGQPAFNSGYRPEARAIAEHFRDVFAHSEYVVVPSGSCASMISHHFADLRIQVAPKVFEFSMFLTEVAKVEDLGARFDGIVTYHDSCHALRDLRVKEGPRRLLHKVRGLELREMDAAEECCGFGGTFSVKFAGVSGGMARTKLESIQRTGADTIVSVDSSCLMQLQGVISREGLKLKTMHLAEVLAGT
jgi:L-lactate dehydrogenase complex protein LldE